ncbi:hypothetical protein [Paenibacillus lactis]|uniref:hypothetical protein n=1 Tax=Paenibacillus lactis TaxID=228574 RepID=UPI0036AA7447
MNWNDTDWSEMDRLYYPKRKVDNTMSRYFGFNIGSIRSQKMNKTVEYESLTECLFYYFLELDPKTIRYYVQPVNVPVSVIKDQELKVYNHVPDVLVYRTGHPPMLFQVKAKDLQEGDKNYASFLRHNLSCEEYARSEQWSYSIIYPRSTDNIVISNVKNIIRYKKKRKHFSELIPQLLYKLPYLENCTIDRLASSFESFYERRYIIPHIYHLIAEAQIWVNLFEPIHVHSEIRLGNSYVTLEETILSEEGSS